MKFHYVKLKVIFSLKNFLKDLLDEGDEYKQLRSEFHIVESEDCLPKEQRKYKEENLADLQIIQQIF